MECMVCERKTAASFWEVSLNRSTLKDDFIETHWSGQLLIICPPCAERIGLCVGMQASIRQTVAEAAEDCPPKEELEPIVGCDVEEPDGLCPNCEPSTGVEVDLEALGIDLDDVETAE